MVFIDHCDALKLDVNALAIRNELTQAKPPTTLSRSENAIPSPPALLLDGCF